MPCSAHSVELVIEQATWAIINQYSFVNLVRSGRDQPPGTDSDLVLLWNAYVKFSPGGGVVGAPLVKASR